MDTLSGQLILIISTTTTLLTAWAWDKVIRQYLKTYHNIGLDNFKSNLIAAIIITILTFLIVFAAVELSKITK